MERTGVIAAGLDADIRAGLTHSGIPGAVALLAARGRTVHHAAYGWALTHDARGPCAAPLPMRPETLFDVASLTKVVATTAVAIALYDRGRLDLDSRASRYLPALRRAGANGITVRQLLEHRAGLATWYPLFLHTDEPAEAVALACRQPLVAQPGTRRVYSDLGMLVLGAALERVAGEPLDALAARLVFEPLGMTTTGFRPEAWAGAPAAATSTGNPVERRLAAELAGAAPELDTGGAGRWRRHTLVSEANDANAALALRGVAGHAGLFSTAGDLARFAHAVLAAARARAQDGPWSPRTVVRFLQPGRHPEQALGFWLRRASAARAARPSVDDSFGHRGFTGCELAASPAADWVAILLTNRLHTPTGEGVDHTPTWHGLLRRFLGEHAAAAGRA